MVKNQHFISDFIEAYERLSSSPDLIPHYKLLHVLEQKRQKVTTTLKADATIFPAQKHRLCGRQYYWLYVKKSGNLIFRFFVILTSVHLAENDYEI